MDIEFDFLCDTLLHMSEVRENLEQFTAALRQRGESHDRSKLQELGFDAFVSTREKFKKANYGTPEYQECVELTRPAVEHHYSQNSHHTAYFANGVDGMSLVDVVEMISDWRAAARRSPDKTLEDTLDYAKKKYGIGDQLFGIILNTLRALGWLPALLAKLEGRE